MTSAAAADSEPGRLRLWLAWFSHFEVPLLGVVIAAVLGRFAAELTVGGIGWLVWVPTVAVFIAVVASFAEFEHMRIYPCDRCMERFPLNASAEAAEIRWAFRVAHWPMKCRLSIIALCSMTIIVPAFWLSINSPIHNLLILPMLGQWGLSTYTYRKHRKLQPWCPWCRRRDEDDDPIVVPEPTPPGARLDA